MKKVCVAAEVLAVVEEFIEEKGAFFEIVSEGGDLSIEDTGQESRESTVSVLYCRGWISCAKARTIASKLKIPLTGMGQLLDHLSIKVKNCGLGCF